ncbi:TylF/MycF family methyltransferase [Candidatus Woesearchaeota archaeon]|nr:TylF/MycF family methyltransferase [Candidatus Woesearchaeota archaeon]
MIQRYNRIIRVGKNMLIMGAHKEYFSIFKGFPQEMDNRFRGIYFKCNKYSMTSIERMYALYKSVEYVVKANVPGAFVECGVWEGGSSMLMAYALLSMGITNRKLYLYDTFEGMSKPTAKDCRISDSAPVMGQWRKAHKSTHNDMGYAPLDRVKRNMFSIGYPAENIVFVKGKVENTIPETRPKTISLLRLDTDWYESTHHELVHLFPRLQKKGVLIIDDYGHFAGARVAVDNYFKKHKINMLLNRVDYTCRVGIKL